MHGILERLFHLRERGTTVRTEVLGGATTFTTMAYIIVVNPAILSFAGLPVGPSTVATIVARDMTLSNSPGGGSRWLAGRRA